MLCPSGLPKPLSRKKEKGKPHQFSERHKVTEKERKCGSERSINERRTHFLVYEDSYNTADVYTSYAPVHLSDTVSKQRV